MDLLVYKEVIDKLNELADRWEEAAELSVPLEYAARNLEHKYFRLDNEAAGFLCCADELRNTIKEITGGDW